MKKFSGILTVDTDWLRTRLLVYAPVSNAVCFALSVLLAHNLMRSGGLLLTCLFSFSLALLLYSRWRLLKRSGVLTTLSLCAIAAVLLLCHWVAPWQSYQRFIPDERPVWVDVRGIVLSRNSAEQVLSSDEGLEKTPLKLTHIRRRGDIAWRPCNGKILLRIWEPLNSGYGSEVRASGVLKLPDKPLLNSDFDYRQYLRVQGIQHWMSAESAATISLPQGWRRAIAMLFHVRDHLLEHAVSGIEAPENRALVAAVALGYRDCIPRAMEADFRRSGMIHIFAISGFHVGLVAIVFGVLIKLCGLSFRLQNVLLPVVLGAYVVMTGAQPSAMRAWLMISVWCIGRFAFRPVLPLNAIAVAAIVLMCINPLCILQTGFQFSFFIVLTLVLGWQKLAEVVNLVHEKRKWVPMTAQTRKFNLCLYTKGYVAKLLGGTFLAWCGAMPLVIYYQNALIPGALLSNLITGLSLMLVALLVVAKLMLFWVPIQGVEFVLTSALERVSAFMRFVAGTIDGPPLHFSVAQVPFFWMIGFYCLVFALLYIGERRLRSLLAGALACWLLIPISWTAVHYQDNRLMVLWGGKAKEPVVVLDRAFRPPEILNAGGYETGRRVGQWLRGLGVDRVEALYLQSGSRYNASGLLALKNDCLIEQVVAPGYAFRGHALQFSRWKAVQHLPTKRVMQRRDGKKLAYILGDGDRQVEIAGTASGRCVVVEWPDCQLRLKQEECAGHTLHVNTEFGNSPEALFLQLPLTTPQSFKTFRLKAE